MRRRFGRRSKENGKPAIDAAQWLGRIREAGLVSPRSLEPTTCEGVPAWFAALGAGESEDGSPLVVAFAPRDAGDALLAALALATERAAAGTFERGRALAIAPGWTAVARRRLALVAPVGFRLDALAAPGLGDFEVEAEPVGLPPAVPLRQVAAQLTRSEDRALFRRAAEGVAGLAAKHGGALRATSEALELILLARRVALLRAGEGVVLENLEDRRTSTTLSEETLAEALDRLEGSLRKRLNDKKVLESEEALRAGAILRATNAAGLRAVARWPLPTGETEVLDFAALDADGRPVAGALRRRFGIVELGAVLDAALELPAAVPAIFAEALPPVRVVMPKIVLGAEALDEAVLRVFTALSLDVERLDLTAGELRPSAVATSSAETRRSESGRGRGGRGDGRRGRGGARRSRRGGRGQRDGGEDGEEASGDGAREESPRFEEMSLFDLGEEDAAPAAEAGERDNARGRRGGRGRGRRGGRGRRNGGGGERGERGESSDEPSASEDAAEPEEAIDERLADGLPALSDDAPDEDEADAAVVVYEDEEEIAEEETPAARLRREREERRQARLARSEADGEEGDGAEADSEDKPRPKRAALCAHADRESLAAGVLLARDVRTLDGLWVYPQSELMTFFRSVATDLRNDTQIFVLGFTASPAREVLEAAALYRGRITWLDHHDWPPEDLWGLRQAIGDDEVVVSEGAGSVLPLVVSRCARRSRFSDKFVDLVAGRFSEHDFGKWGRFWWSRLAELAERGGDRRTDIEPLLAGRPSDLAKDAAGQETPPPPPELAWATDRDFRLVHFGGYTMVLVPTPPELSLALAGRIVRERYAAQLSLAWHEDAELMIFGGDEAASKYGLDLTGMVQHLGSKHDWIEVLPDDDHVARFRARDLATQPERIDVVVSEIAMGRSIFEA